MNHTRTITSLNAVERECLKNFLRRGKVPTLRVLMKFIELGLIRKGRDCYEACPGVDDAWEEQGACLAARQEHPAIATDEEERHG